MNIRTLVSPPRDFTTAEKLADLIGLIGCVAGIAAAVSMFVRSVL